MFNTHFCFLIATVIIVSTVCHSKNKEPLDTVEVILNDYQSMNQITFRQNLFGIPEWKAKLGDIDVVISVNDNDWEYLLFSLEGRIPNNSNKKLYSKMNKLNSDKIDFGVVYAREWTNDKIIVYDLKNWLLKPYTINDLETYVLKMLDIG
eukprot:355425_1